MSTTIDDLTVPVRTCTPWCEDGPEKHATQHPDDRSCWSTFNVVPLSSHQPLDNGQGRWVQASLNVYLRRRAGQDHSLVYIHSEETDAELLLTDAEAKELHRVLGTLIGTAAAES